MNERLLLAEKNFLNIFFFDTTLIKFRNQLNAENLPTVKSIDIKPLLTKAKYQLKICQILSFHNTGKHVVS